MTTTAISYIVFLINYYSHRDMILHLETLERDLGAHYSYTQ